MPNFDLTGELSLKIELHMLRPITEKVHSGNEPVSLVVTANLTSYIQTVGASSLFAIKQNNSHFFILSPV